MAERRRRPITAEDLFRFRLVSDPQLSPDGARIVYVVKETDQEKNRYFSHLWVVGAREGEGRAFTRGEQCDHTPRWSPDGRAIAFLSDREEKTQLWQIPVDGGNERVI